MQDFLFVLAVILAGLRAAPDSAAEKARLPDIVIQFEQPQGEFALGQPILLTVVFKNHLKRDLRIVGFSPGSHWGYQEVRMCSSRSAGCQCAMPWRKVTATTDVEVERISGKPQEQEGTFEIEPGEPAFFILKAGASAQRSFDLMHTLWGAFEIDSPGRFRVSLSFKVEVKQSKGYPGDGLEWAREARTEAIEITVIDPRD